MTTYLIYCIASFSNINFNRLGHNTINPFHLSLLNSKRFVYKFPYANGRISSCLHLIANALLKYFKINIILSILVGIIFKNLRSDVHECFSYTD